MIAELNLPLIMLAAFVGAASPGPATLTIAGTSMNNGRKHGLALASGVFTGSMIWSISAALGLGVIMQTNAWMFEALRYIGAVYLIFLAYKSARSALSKDTPYEHEAVNLSIKKTYAKGLALHLTNPKAVLFFGSLFAIGIPQDTSPNSIMLVIAAIGLQSFVIFHGYALLFSNQRMISGYQKLRRGFDTVFAVAFGAAGLKILTTKIE